MGVLELSWNRMAVENPSLCRIMGWGAGQHPCLLLLPKAFWLRRARSMVCKAASFCKVMDMSHT